MVAGDCRHSHLENGMPRTLVETLGRALKATSIPVSAGTQAIQLLREAKRVSIIAIGGAVRYEIKVGDTVNADAALSHYLADGERLDLAIPEGDAKLAVIRATSSLATAVEVTELS
jgi:hypothetical protein